MGSLLSDCFACSRIRDIRAGKNPWFIKEMRESFAVLCDGQFYKGWTNLLLKNHREHVVGLSDRKAARLYRDVMDICRALDKAFKPRRLNLENLGNTMAHIHWHVIPRYARDPDPKKPIWRQPLKKLTKKPSSSLRTGLIRSIRSALG